MMYAPSSWWAKFFFEHTTLKSIHILNSYSIIFTILKSYFINYIIPFYNTPNIPKLYYFTILLKYYFLIVLEEEGKHKHFFIHHLSFFFFIPLSLSLSLSLLSHFSVIEVWLCSGSCVCEIVGLCSGCGSWVVDREFVIWVRGFMLQLWYGVLLVVFRWVFVGYRNQIYGFGRA